MINSSDVDGRKSALSHKHFFRKSMKQKCDSLPDYVIHTIMLFQLSINNL